MSKVWELHSAMIISKERTLCLSWITLLPYCRHWFQNLI